MTNKLIRQINWLKANRIKDGDKLIVKPDFYSSELSPHTINILRGRQIMVLDSVYIDSDGRIGVFCIARLDKHIILFSFNYTSLFKATHYKCDYKNRVITEHDVWNKIPNGFKMNPDYHYQFGIEERNKIIPLQSKKTLKL